MDQRRPPSDPSTKSTDPVDRHVGSRIRLRRTVVGMTQRELGREIGVTYQQVQKYEDGRNRIGASRLQRIAHVLEAPIEFFFGSDGDAEAVADDADATRYSSTSDSVDLVKAFSAIADQRVRREIVRLVHSIAEAQDGKPGVEPTRP